MIHYGNFKLYLRLGLKLKKIHRLLELNQSQRQKQYVEFNTKTRIEAKKKKKKNGDKDGKVFCRLISNAVYGKTMEKLRNRIDVNLVSTKITI